MDRAEIPVVIPCGGKGTRIREASDRLPKPMIEVGGRPIVWHIMKIYYHHGFRRFVLPLGYKGWEIKNYFLRYREMTGNIRVGLADGSIEVLDAAPSEDWELTLVETGLETGTAARLSMVRQHLDADHFMLTYGDGVADVDLGALADTHVASGKLVTVTAVHPVSRFGELTTNGGDVISFMEKPEIDSGSINGGFFMFRTGFLDYVNDDSGMLESDPLPKVVRDGAMGLYRHNGFWRSMDTFREWNELNEMWDSGDAPWKIWKEDRQL
jgi:glucose-1-phosphate cytidylyltransferase